LGPTVDTGNVLKDNVNTNTYGRPPQVFIDFAMLGAGRSVWKRAVAPAVETQAGLAAAFRFLPYSIARRI
jgi:hypothetical protein